MLGAGGVRDRLEMLRIFFGGVVYQSKEKTGMERVKTGKMISHRI